MIRKIKNIYIKVMVPNKGFSLIEILVAAAIGSMILVMMQQLYSTTLKSMDKMVIKAEEYENISLTISKMDNDFSNAYLKRTNDKLVFICEVKADNSIINFVTVNHFNLRILGNIKKTNPISDIKEIGYYLRKQLNEGNETDLYELIRREQNLYDDEPKIGGRESVLLENVVSLKFQFREGNDWTDHWDSQNTKRFPKIIKTTIALYKGKQDQEITITDENTQVYEFISRINIQP